MENASDAIAEANNQILGGRDRSLLDKTHAWLSLGDLTASVYPRSGANGSVLTPS
jgi:hypothetical protein